MVGKNPKSWHDMNRWRWVGIWNTLIDFTLCRLVTATFIFVCCLSYPENIWLLPVLAQSILAQVNGLFHMMTPLTLALLDWMSCVLFSYYSHWKHRTFTRAQKILQPNSFTPFQKVIILQEKLGVCYSPITGHNLERKRSFQTDFIFILPSFLRSRVKYFVYNKRSSAVTNGTKSCCYLTLQKFSMHVNFLHLQRQWILETYSCCCLSAASTTLWHSELWLLWWSGVLSVHMSTLSPKCWLSWAQSRMMDQVITIRVIFFSKWPEYLQN
jgi:hypothetical protein